MNMLTPTGHIANDSSADHHHHSLKVYFDRTYISSAAGLLKITQAMVSLLGYICMKVITRNYHFPAGSYYEFVTFVGFFMALILGALHTLHIVDATNTIIPWIFLELVYSLVWSLLYCVAGGIVASWASYHTALGASAFFAFVGTLLYGYEALEKSKRKLREGISSDRQRSRGGSCVTIS